jgi:hypothetical protein
MAYYGGGYASTQFTAGYPPIAVQPGGLASYGGPYRVNQPAYYAGPSYSTTSDNDFQFGPSFPLNNYQYGGGGGGVYAPGSGYIGSYGVPTYAAENTSYYPYYQPNAPVQSQTFSHIPQQQVPLIEQQQQQSQSISGSQIQMQQASTPTPGGGGGVQTDDMCQLAPQIDAAYQAATGQRRQPVIKRQVITVPGQPARVQQVVRRLPTPTPDIIERVFVVKPHRDIVNLIIERPVTPPAQYRDRCVYGKPRRPLINPRIIRVPPRLQYEQQPPMSASPYQFSPPPQLPYFNSSYQFPQPGTMSQGQLSQSSQTQLLPPQMSQTQLDMRPKGYLIAPVQFDEANYVQTNSLNFVPPMPPTLSYAPNSPAVYGLGVPPTGPASPAYFASTAAYPTPFGARVF